MLTPDKLDRINHLARKSKQKGLTRKEKNEQQQLRQEYLRSIRKSFKNQLKSVTIVDPEGNDVTPKKLQTLQKKDNK